MTVGTEIDLMHSGLVRYTIVVQEVRKMHDGEYHVWGRMNDGRAFETYGIYVRRSAEGRFSTPTWGIYSEASG